MEALCITRERYVPYFLLSFEFIITNFTVHETSCISRKILWHNILLCSFSDLQSSSNRCWGTEVTFNGSVWEAPGSEVLHLCPRLWSKRSQVPRRTWFEPSYSKTADFVCICFLSFSFSSSYFLILHPFKSNFNFLFHKHN